MRSFWLILVLLCDGKVSEPPFGSEPIDCDTESGWNCDYEPKFSHRDGNHTFCDFEVLSLNDELINQIHISSLEINHTTYAISSLSTFLEKCYFKKPCLINASIEDWTDPAYWNRDQLLSTHSDYVFDSGKSLDLVLRAGHGELKYSLREYIKLNDENKNNYKHKEPMYIFDRTIWRTENRKFRENHIKLHNVSFIKYASTKIDYNAKILALGNTGTGATFHAHGENWLFLISGRKRWFLYPPNTGPIGGFWPGYSTKDWFEFIYPYLHRQIDFNNRYDALPNYNLTEEMNARFNKPRSNILFRNVSGEIIQMDERENVFLTDYADMNDDQNYGNAFFKPMECIQSKGQIIYVPEFWWHSVINLGNVVIGAAMQSAHSRMPWMRERDVHDRVRRELGHEKFSDLEGDAQRNEAIQAYERLARYGPISAVHHFFMGFEYYDMGIYDWAVFHLTNALLIDPTYLEAYSYLGRIYYFDPSNGFHDMEMAEAILRIGYLLNPHNDSVYRELFDVLRRTRQDENDNVHILRKV